MIEDISFPHETPSALRVRVLRRKQALDTIREILVTNLHVQMEAARIDPDTFLFGTGLALDSVDALELVVATEAHFGVRLPETALKANLRTLNTLVDAIFDLQDEGGAP